MKKKTISRREFIKDGAAALAAGSLVLAWPWKTWRPDTRKNQGDPYP